MAGLKLPWHKRRTTSVARADASFVARLLQLNLGKGYYAYDHFAWAPEVLSDASKSSHFAGGGYVSQCGRYRLWPFGASARRQPIDYLEGDTCVVAVEDLRHLWRKCMVPFGLDNMAFQRSQVKGRSGAERLNDLLKHLFVEQVRGEFILATFWLASEANYLADDLSRDREELFLQRVWASGFVQQGAPLRRHPSSGVTRTLVERPGAMDALRQLLDTCTSNTNKDGPQARVSRFADTVPHARATLTRGLPGELLTRLEALLDNRHSASSWRTIRTGMSKWRTVATAYGWPTVIDTDDHERGAKLVALVLLMVDDTDLAWSSINSYVWGMRRWMQLQHQADPVAGVDGWDSFTQAAAVLAHVPAEPRVQIPLEVVEEVLQALDPSIFWEAQLGFFFLTLLFTFSRSECPCPKNFTGPESFDRGKHWEVRDIQLVIVDLLRGFKINFKSVKQDPRIERPQARGSSDGDSGDWSYVGDIPDSVFSMSRWYSALMQHYGGTRPGGDPFFMAKDQERAYTYSAAMADLRVMLDRIDCTARYGLHSLRVLGYNLSKRANGEAITVAHGLWLSSAHTRYERFGMPDVMAMAANMVRGVDPAAQPARVGERALPAVRTAVRRGSSDAADAAVDVAEADVEAHAPDTVAVAQHPLLPDGYSQVEHVGPSGRVYHTFVAPDGTALRSRVECWRHEDSHRGAASTPSAVASSAGPRPRASRPRGRARVAPAADSQAERVDEATASEVESPVPDSHAEPAGAIAASATESPPSRARPLESRFDLVEVVNTQCGNPACLVPSINGRHAGACRFPEPPPRRRHGA